MWRSAADRRKGRVREARGPESGRWVDTYWYILPLFGLLTLPVVVLVSLLLRHWVSGALPGWVWLGALLGVPLLLHRWVWFALLLPCGGRGGRVRCSAASFRRTLREAGREATPPQPGGHRLD